MMAELYVRYGCDLTVGCDVEEEVDFCDDESITESYLEGLLSQYAENAHAECFACFLDENGEEISVEQALQIINGEE